MDTQQMSRQCEKGILSIVLGISILLAVFNIFALLFLLCMKSYNEVRFAFIFGVEVILTGVMMILGFAEIVKSSICGTLRLYSQIVGIEALITLFLTIITHNAPFHIAIRYTNSPGNSVWIFLFLGMAWNTEFKLYFLIFGFINLVITTSTIFVNFISLIKGLKKSIKRLLKIQWIIALLLLWGSIIAAIFLYLKSSQQKL